MIERLEGMPDGVVGLRASGKLSKEDYVEGLEPALREGIESGLQAWVRDHSAWKRLALVTDVEWVAKAMRMFAWLTPGEVMVCEPEELERAKAWVAG